MNFGSWGMQSGNQHGQFVGAQQQQNGNSMIVFINDDSIVASYPVALGYTVALINVNDPNDGKMFIKSVDANGMPNQTRVFSLNEVTPRMQGVDVVSRKEFDELNNQYTALSAQLQQIISVMQAQPEKKEAKK